MIHLTEIEMEIMEVRDMKTTVNVLARDVNEDVTVSLTFGSADFHMMSEEDINHALMRSLAQRIEHKRSMSLQKGMGIPEDSNLTIFKKKMLTREHIKLGK